MDLQQGLSASPPPSLKERTAVPPPPLSAFEASNLGPFGFNPPPAVQPLTKSYIRHWAKENIKYHVSKNVR